MVTNDSEQSLALGKSIRGDWQNIKQNKALWREGDFILLKHNTEIACMLVKY